MTKDSTLRRVLPALLVCLIWGVNFSAITAAEQELSPVTLGFLRFFLCVFPVIFFLPRPGAPAKYIVGYGLTWGLFQFIFLFIGMSSGVGSGTASFLLQSQAFFTIGLSFVLLSEKLARHQSVGLGLGAVGIALVVVGNSQSLSLTGALLVVIAGFSWASGNIIIKVSRPEEAFSFIVYSSAVAVVPFLVLALMVDGYDQMVGEVKDLSLWGAGSLAYLVYPTTLFGYWIWNKLLRTYSAAKVTPFALLIPIVGSLSGEIIFDERPSSLQYVGFSVILVGLIVSQFWSRISRSATV